MGNEKIIQEFEQLSQSKKQSALVIKLSLLFAFIIVVAVLVWGLLVSQMALDKIVVIERSGEYVKTVAESREDLFVSLIKTTCAHTAHYANSFERKTINGKNGNQARAMMYVNKDHLNPIFSLYQNQQSYHHALERGVIYECELEDVKIISDTKPYHVKFTSVLTIYDAGKTTKRRIFSEGTLVPVKAQYPENVTGLFFNTYKQSIKNFNDGDE